MNPFRLQIGSVRDDRLSRKYESYSVDRATGSVVDISQTNERKDFLGLSVKTTRSTLLFAGILLAIIVLMGRLLFLQIMNGEKYYAMAEGNRVRILPIKANRGIIFDRHGKQITKNIPRFIVKAHPIDLPRKAEDRKPLFEELADLLRIPKEERDAFIQESEEKVSANVYRKFESEILWDKLEHDEALLLKIQLEHIPGFSVETENTREYIYDNIYSEQLDANLRETSLSHVLGYMGRISAEQKDDYLDKGYVLDDMVGKAGLEYEYEDILKGSYGKEKIEVDALGRTVKELAKEEAVPGKNIVLSVDMEMQNMAEMALREVLDTYEKEIGTVIIQDPNSGEILTMVNIPNYDNNIFSIPVDNDAFYQLTLDERNPLLNRAVLGEYPSGSTFKPVVAAAALEEGIITPYTTIQSYGGIRISLWFFPDWKAGGHGATNVYKALGESVNTFFYAIGGGYGNIEGLGIDRITNYASRFGFGHPLGIDLPSERDGLLPSKEWKQEVKGERWYIGDTYHAAIGQGDILVTPLQVNAMTATIANGGTLYKPHFLKHVEKNGDMVLNNSAEQNIIRNNVTDPESIEVVKIGLGRAVSSGSAQRLGALAMSSGGKTGTAQWSSEGEPHAWYTGFAPYDNPKIAFTILIEKGEEGSKTAVAVADKILRWYQSERWNK